MTGTSLFTRRAELRAAVASSEPLPTAYPSTEDGVVDAAPSAVAYDAPLLAIFSSPLCGESYLAGFARKEAELRGAIARLSVVDAAELLRRLTCPISGDALAAQLNRLTPERRRRLIAFVADAPRRQSQAAPAAGARR